MGEAAFFRDDAKKRAAEAVKAAEAQTSAEIVVAVRKRSGNYRATDYHFGFIGFGIAVTYMMVAPQIFTVETMALDGILAFVVFTLLSANVSAIRRLLVRKRTLEENALCAGRATFYELGISRTKGRNGVLVFVSAFERVAAIIADTGIDAPSLGPEWVQACDAVRSAVKRMDLEAFLDAIKNLGVVLGKSMPRSKDDVNELPDEVQ
jgi:putative membrane protein